MSPGPRDAAREKAEAAAILAMLPRAEWRNSVLESQITALLSRVDGFPAQRFINEFLRPAISDFFCLTYYDGGRRRSMLGALVSLTKAIRATRAALSELHFAGIGTQFEAGPRSGRQRALDHEEAVAQELLSRLRGSGHDAARPVRVFIRALMEAWDQCGGPAIEWDGWVDFDDLETPDAHPFFEMVLLIFDQFRSAAATAGSEPTPTIFAGAPEFKLTRIPSQGSILNAFRIVRSERVPKA